MRFPSALISQSLCVVAAVLVAAGAACFLAPRTPRALEVEVVDLGNFDTSSPRHLHVQFAEPRTPRNRNERWQLSTSSNLLATLEVDGTEIRYWLYPQSEPGRHDAFIVATSSTGARREYRLTYRIAVSKPSVSPLDIVRLDPPEIDFGELRYDTPCDRVVHLKNVGSSTVAVRTISLSCGCMSIPNAFQGELRPGEQGQFTCRGDVRSLPAGPIARHATVEFLGGEIMQIPSRAVVVAPYTLDPPQIAFGRVTANQSEVASMEIRVTPGESPSDVRWHSESPAIELAEIGRTDDSLRLSIRLLPNGTAGNLTASILIEKQGHSWSQRVPVTATIDSGIRAAQRFWSFGTVASDRLHSMQQRIECPEGGSLSIVPDPTAPWSGKLTRFDSTTYQLIVAFDPRECTKSVSDTKIGLRWENANRDEEQSCEVYCVARMLGNAPSQTAGDSQPNHSNEPADRER